MAAQKTSEKNQSSTPSPQDIRRKYIYEQMINLRRISVEDIKWKINEEKIPEDCVEINTQSIQADIEFWEKTLGWDIQRIQGKQKRIFWQRSDAPSYQEEAGHMSKQSRENQDRLPKQKIAQLALGALIGSGSEQDLFVDYKCRSGDHLKGGTLSALISAAENDPQLDARIRKSIIEKLNTYANTSVRSAFLDASTTVDQVADLLARVHLPIEVVKPSDDELEILYSIHKGSYIPVTPSLQYLEVWTNNRYIFNKLGDREISLRSIVLPGWQDPENDSLCSYLATDFIDRIDPQFSIALIGAKSIELKDGYFCTDHAADAKLIGQIIERSKIVIVLASSSKLDGQVSGAVKRCCKLVGKIDFVITDIISPDNDTMGYINKLKRSGVMFLSTEQLQNDHAIILKKRATQQT